MTVYFKDGIGFPIGNQHFNVFFAKVFFFAGVFEFLVFKRDPQTVGGYLRLFVMFVPAKCCLELARRSSFFRFRSNSRSKTIMPVSQSP